LKNYEGIKDVVLLEKSTGLACGSTFEITDEAVIVGMLSLLIVTIDKVTKEMELKNFREFKLKTDSNYILIENVTKDRFNRLCDLMKEISHKRSQLKVGQVDGVLVEYVNKHDKDYPVHPHQSYP